MTQKQNHRAFCRPHIAYTPTHTQSQCTLHTAPQQFHTAQLNCCVTMLRETERVWETALESGTSMCILKICEQLTFAFCRRPQPEICEVFVVDTISFKMEFIMQTGLSLSLSQKWGRCKERCGPLREIIHNALANKETIWLCRWR